MGMRRSVEERFIRQHLMSLLQIPVLGEVFYAFPAGSSSSQYEGWVEALDIPSELKFQGNTAIANGENAMTANRNDVLCVFPGAYDIDTELDWDKAQCHLVGMGGPNTYGDYSEFNVVIYTDTAGTVQTIDVSGKNCQFHNFAVANKGASTASVAALKVDKHGLYFKNVRFQGTMTSQQAGNANCASLIITGNGFYPQFHNCIIGENEWATRTAANSGALLFPGSAGAPSNGLFKDCRFILRSDTATTALVAVSGVDYIGRGWLFDNCFFHCLSGNQTEMNRVFYMNTSGSDNIPSVNLHHCFAANFAQWQTDDNDAVEADMPITGAGGGIGQQPDAAVGS